MPVLTIYRGYPGSGKKEVAQEKASREGGILVDRDTIRKMHFGKTWGLKRRQEQTVSESYHTIISNNLKHGTNVHVTDTNLNQDSLVEMVKVGLEAGAKVVVHDVETTPLECVKRMHLRREMFGTGEHTVPDKVIWDMARRYPMPWPVAISLVEDEETKMFSVVAH